ncbi:hypothetical protein C4552_04050 [Candidatus Parcubacteria bacterium]|nr:MAG: hypothetical protein C4552_04050 [Candidatus Parcubacteria bacterium]
MITEAVAARINQLYVNPQERTPNEVDRLLDQIAKIRESCAHDFRLLVPMKPLPPSLVPDVLIGARHPNRAGYYADPQELRFYCLKCSDQGQADVTTRCPRCLGRMIQPREYEDRAKYFGSWSAKYSARLYTCSDCGQEVVMDEYKYGCL